MSNTGMLIKQKRKEKKLTLEEVSKRVGLSKSTLSKIENNKIENLKRSTLISLSNLLDISPIELIDGIEYEIKQSISIQDFLVRLAHLLYQTNELNETEKSLIKNYVQLICENKNKGD